jgi:hypothetical protein
MAYLTRPEFERACFAYVQKRNEHSDISWEWIDDPVRSMRDIEYELPSEPSFRSFALAILVGKSRSMPLHRKVRTMGFTRI